MRLYLDDDLDGDLLIALLRRHGHEAVSPRAAGTSGIDDEKHLEYAAARGLVLMTRNAAHFIVVHERWIREGRSHAGILAVYRENNPARDMRPGEIAAAVSRLDESATPLRNSFQNLNFWR